MSTLRLATTVLPVQVNALYVVLSPEAKEDTDALAPARVRAEEKGFVLFRSANPICRDIKAPLWLRSSKFMLSVVTTAAARGEGYEVDAAFLQ